MTDMFAEFVARHRMPGEQPWVMPAYDGESIMNLASSLLGVFGPMHGTPLAWHADFLAALRGRRRLIFLIVDGLGWMNLEAAAARRPVIAEMVERAWRRPLTSVFPSTTSVALTSYLTAEPPARHGVIGFLMYFPQYDRVFNMLSFAGALDPKEDLLSFGFQPEQFIGSPSILRRAAEHGILAGAYNFQAYIGSGLSRLIYHDCQPHPYLALGDLIAAVRAQVHAPLPQFSLLYWSTIDTLAHTYGAHSEAYVTELAVLMTALRDELLPALDEETALVICADHGHIDGDDGQAIQLATLPTVSPFLRVPPAGDSRAQYIYLRHGSETRAAEGLHATGEITVLTRDEFLETRLLGEGPLHPGTEERVGDLIALPHGSRRILYDYQPRPHTAMIGRHGGLMPEEMVVPVLVY